MTNTQATTTKHKHILLVDDEEQVLFVISESLRKLGSLNEVIIATSEQSVLALFRSNVFDLVITDLKMPGISGIELTEAIRTIDPNIPIIWMTAFGNNTIRADAQRLNVQHCLAKPLDITDIRQIAHEALEISFQHQNNIDISSTLSNDDLRKCMSQLRSDTGAYAVLLTTAIGNPIETIGITKDMDVTTLSTLVAGNFLAAHEIAQVLGRESNFKLSYHERDQHNIYAYCIGKKYLVIIVFGSETRTGVVWFYTQRVVGELEKILTKIEIDDSFDSKLSPLFIQEAENELDDLLETISITTPSESATETQRQPDNSTPTTESPTAAEVLLSFEDAVARGIIHDDTLSASDANVKIK